MDVEELLDVMKRPAGKYYYHDDIDLLDGLVGVREYLKHTIEEWKDDPAILDLVIVKNLTDLLKLCGLSRETRLKIIGEYFQEMQKNLKLL